MYKCYALEQRKSRRLNQDKIQFTTLFYKEELICAV